MIAASGKTLLPSSLWLPVDSSFSWWFGPGPLLPLWLLAGGWSLLLEAAYLPPHASHEQVEAFLGSALARGTYFAHLKFLLLSLLHSSSVVKGS